MKAAVFVLIASIANTCAAPSPAALGMRPVTSGAFAASQEAQPRAVLATDAETFRRLWATLIGTGDAPAVDFNKESTVFLLAGERGTGGYEIVPRGVSQRGTTLVIDAEVTSPPKDAMVIQSLTYPFVVIAVSKKDYDRVEWKP